MTAPDAPRADAAAEGLVLRVSEVARILAHLSMGPIALVYRAWGRRWLTDGQCRWLVTTIMRSVLRLARS